MMKMSPMGGIQIFILIFLLILSVGHSINLGHVNKESGNKIDISYKKDHAVTLEIMFIMDQDLFSKKFKSGRKVEQYMENFVKELNKLFSFIDEPRNVSGLSDLFWFRKLNDSFIQAVKYLTLISFF